MNFQKLILKQFSPCCQLNLTCQNVAVDLLNEALKTLSPSALQKMKKDHFSQLDDYDAPFCEQQYTHGPCYISLLKFKSFDQFNPPPRTS